SISLSPSSADYTPCMSWLTPSFCPLSPMHTARPATSPLSLHDALPISPLGTSGAARGDRRHPGRPEVLSGRPARSDRPGDRATEIGRDTSELQSRFDIVCRLLLEKKKIERTVHVTEFLSRVHTGEPTLS